MRETFSSILENTVSVPPPPDQGSNEPYPPTSQKLKQAMSMNK